MRILVLGAGGFIGSHLVRAILRETEWRVTGIDLDGSRLADLPEESRLSFHRGDLIRERAWVEDQIQQSDVVVPLAAVATPSSYVEDPLHVFELTFEENLRIVRLCRMYRKRLVFPSSSEVYGMAGGEEFDETETTLVYGPVQKERWIYGASKQLLERILWAYASRGQLRCTVFRPFNWVGPGLDDRRDDEPGASRVVAQFIEDLVSGRPLQVVDGGGQTRCLTDVDDGIEALLRILENRDGCCDGQTFNLGHPGNEITVRALAERLIELYRSRRGDTSGTLVDVSGERFYGAGYQDIPRRKPSIERARALLGWEPRSGIEAILERTLDAFLARKGGAASADSEAVGPGGEVGVLDEGPDVAIAR